MTKIPERNCKHCNRKFQPKNASAKFHSDSCRVMHWNEQKRKREQMAMQALRSALVYCVNKHPDLKDTVNEKLRTAKMELV